MKLFVFFPISRWEIMLFHCDFGNYLSLSPLPLSKVTPVHLRHSQPHHNWRVRREWSHRGHPTLTSLLSFWKGTSICIVFNELILIVWLHGLQHITWYNCKSRAWKINHLIAKWSLNMHTNKEENSVITVTPGMAAFWSDSLECWNDGFLSPSWMPVIMTVLLAFTFIELGLCNLHFS